MKTSDGRTSIPSGELLSHPTKKPQQNRPSVGARGFEPLAPSEDGSARSNHNTEAGRPTPDSELLASAFSTGHVTVYLGDALSVLRGLPAESVDCCVTSPPYWGLRDYGTATWDGGDADCDHTFDRTMGMRASTLGGGKASQPKSSVYRTCPKCGARRIDSQLGLEPTPAEYVQNMVEVFREVRRVLRPHGTLWLNLGDSYSGSGPSGASYQSKTTIARAGKSRDGAFAISDTLAARGLTYAEKKPIPAEGLKAKDMVGIPWRVAFALQADGWYLRSDIIWAKPNPMPESVTDRPTKSHEYVFLMSKSPRYFFDQDAVREPLKPGADHDRPVSLREDHRGFSSKGDDIDHVMRSNAAGRNIRTVWTIATQPYPDAHFATFPRELPERCIKAGCPESVCVQCGTVIIRGTNTTPLRGMPEAVRGEVDTPEPAGAGPLLLEGVREQAHRPNPIIDEGFRADGEGLHRALPADSSDGDANGIRSGASVRDGGAARATAVAQRGRRSHQHDQGRQPTGESSGADQADPRRPIEPGTGADGALSEVQSPLPAPWACGQCGADLSSPGAIRQGVTLDPFAGSGTTLAVARDLGRKSIGIELNPAYVKLIERRCAQEALELGA